MPVAGSDWYSWEGDTLTLHLRVQPRASRDEITGVHGQQLKVRLAAPPVDGAANRTLLKFLAKSCGVPVAQVMLASGATGRDKRVKIERPRLLPAGVARPDSAT